MTVTLTDARPADARDLAAILRGWIGECDWFPNLHTPEEDTTFLRNVIRRQSVRVARRDGQAVGFLARDWDHLTCLYLAPEARGQGIGARLLAEAKAAEPSLTVWAFQADSRAIAFYRREGFEEAERTDGEGNEEHLPDVRLIWQAAKGTK